MLQSSTAHWCELRIGAASGQAGPEIWPSRTHAQTGKRLAGYGDLSLPEKTAYELAVYFLVAVLNRPMSLNRMSEVRFGVVLDSE